RIRGIAGESARQADVEALDARPGQEALASGHAGLRRAARVVEERHDEDRRPPRLLLEQPGGAGEEDVVGVGRDVEAVAGLQPPHFRRPHRAHAAEAARSRRWAARRRVRWANGSLATSGANTRSTPSARWRYLCSPVSCPRSIRLRVAI